MKHNSVPPIFRKHININLKKRRAKKYFHSARLRLISAEVVFVYRDTTCDLLESKRMAAMIRAIKARKS
jgi:hypothetical protein